MSKMSFKQVQAEVIPEYQKSLFDWGGTRKGKQFTVTAPRVTTVKVKITRKPPPPPPQMSAPSVHASSPQELPNTPVKCAAPASTASGSSPLTSLSSASTGAFLDASLQKKRKLSSASSPSEPSSSMTRDVTPSTPPKTTVNDVNDASALSSSSSLKRVRSTEDASKSPKSWEMHETEDVALPPLPSKRVRKLKDTSMRETTASPNVSADTSRSSSPLPSELSVLKKSTSRAVNDSIKQVKRRKRRALTNLALPPKKGSYRALEPVFVRDTSTPGSISACESETNYTPPKPRQTWTEEDGCVGDQLRTSEEVVRRLAGMGRYITLFRNPNDPDDKTFELSEFPTVELEYPNSGAKESFVLARPKDRDHYDPTYDIEDTLRAFIKDIVPPEYKDSFGPLPEDVLQNIVDSDGDDENRSSSEAPEIPLARQRRTYAHSLQPPVASRPAASECGCGTPPPPTSSRCSPSPKGLMKTLLSARHRKDGPTYRATLEEINKCIRGLKEGVSDGNLLRAVPRTWSMTGIPRGVVFRIIEETYQRCVGPRISQLRKYEAFSSNVYGELTPAFVNDIIEKTKLSSDHLFLDLGSGVGNVVLQASLQTGCKAFGIEEREDMARIADEQFEQIQLRCRMWGVSTGKAELVQGDMTTSLRVDQLMSKADVVLVNNYVFSEELNTALRPKFLDLKEGAYVVSLKPFAPPRTQMLTERNFDDISAIFDVSAHPYHSGTVSWSSGSGTYYIHHVNREGYKKSREALLRRMERRRSTRR